MKASALSKKSSRPRVGNSSSIISTHFRSVGIVAEVNAIVGRVLSVGMLRRDEHQSCIERERADAAAIAALGADKFSD
jgi:hypothetical protein